MRLWICALLLSPTHILRSIGSKKVPHQSNSRLSTELVRSSSEGIERPAYYFSQQILSMKLRNCFNAIAANDPQQVAKMIINLNPARIYPGTNKTLFQAHAELIDGLRKKSSSRLNNDFTRADIILSLLLKKAAQNLEKQ